MLGLQHVLSAWFEALAALLPVRHIAATLVPPQGYGMAMAERFCQGQHD